LASATHPSQAESDTLTAFGEASIGMGIGAPVRLAAPDAERIRITPAVDLAGGGQRACHVRPEVAATAFAPDVVTRLNRPANLDFRCVYSTLLRGGRGQAGGKLKLSSRPSHHGMVVVRLW
jgi:hypothetical protein